MQRQIKLLARAKINLSIDVLNKREDGFHDVEMIMQSINLADEMVVTCKEATHTTISIAVQGIDIPTDHRNIMWKAVERILEASKNKANVHIDITKKIPTQAGLGGGSADGAAVLFAMRELLALPFNTAKLTHLGAQLGSDVPFMFDGGTALATGRGEIVTPIEPIESMWVVLIKPKFGISTANAYQQIGQAKITHPDVMLMKKQIEQRKPFVAIAPFAGNVIEQAVSETYPLINQLKEELIDQGAISAMLSGSGSTVYGLFQEKEKAMQASQQLKRRYNDWCQVVSTSQKGIEVMPMSGGNK